MVAAAVMLAIGLIGSGEYLRHAVPLHWPPYVYPIMVLVSLGISYYQTMSEDAGGHDTGLAHPGTG